MDHQESRADVVATTTTTTSSPSATSRFSMLRIHEIGAGSTSSSSGGCGNSSSSNINLNNNINPTIGKVTSVDSGVETGNDSNDSAIVQFESYSPDGLARLSRFDRCRRTSDTTTMSPSSSSSSSSSSSLPSLTMISPFSCNRVSLGESSAAASSSSASSSSPSTTTMTVATLGQPWVIPDEIDRPVSSLSRAIIEVGDLIHGGYSRCPRSAMAQRSLQHLQCRRLRDARLRKECSFDMENQGPGKSRRLTSRGFMSEESGMLVRRLVDERRLRVAASTNNVEEVRRLLESGVRPNACDDKMRTPLHLASGRGYAEVVRLLLAHGANPRLQDCIGNTPLHLATVTCKLEVVTLLLDAAKEPLWSGFRGLNSLQLAGVTLRVLQNYMGKDKHMTSEVREMVNALLADLKKRDGFGQQVDALSTICSRLTLSGGTSDDIPDEVRDLLCNIDSLSLRDFENRRNGAVDVPARSND